jgi:hypothetical protein
MAEITPTPNVGTVLRLTVNFDPVDEYNVGTVLRLTVGFGRRRGIYLDGAIHLS